MISRYTYKKITWVDVESPTKEELSALMDEFDIPEVTLEQLRISAERGKIHLHENLMFLVLSFPATDHSDKKNTEKEAFLTVGKNFILTIRNEVIHPLYQFSKFFEENSVLNKDKMTEHAGHLFIDMIGVLHKDIFRQLNQTDILLAEIEDGVFAGHEGHMIEIISKLNSRVLSFERSILSQGEILKSLDMVGCKLFGDQLGHALSEVASEHKKVKEILKNQKEMLRNMKETNDSLIFKKTKNRMKTLVALVSCTILLLVLIAVALWL